MKILHGEVKQLKSLYTEPQKKGPPKLSKDIPVQFPLNVIDNMLVLDDYLTDTQRQHDLVSVHFMKYPHQMKKETLPLPVILTLSYILGSFSVNAWWHES